MRLFASEWPTHVVSVLVGDVPRYDWKHLHVRFDDIVRPQPGLILPAPEHLNRIYEFASTLSPDSRLLVHCHRGLNRSPAVAVGALIQTGMEYTEALRRAVEQCPRMEPNHLVMLYIDRHFGLGGKLIGLARSNRRIRQHEWRRVAGGPVRQPKHGQPEQHVKSSQNSLASPQMEEEY